MGRSAAGALRERARLTLRAIKFRLFDPRSASFAHYGNGKVTIADDFADPAKFIPWFVEHWKPGLTIDRIDNARGYDFGNCQFITQREQNLKQARIIHLLPGVPLSIAAEAAGVNLYTARGRYRRGESPADVLRPAGAPRLDLRQAALDLGDGLAAILPPVVRVRPRAARRPALAQVQLTLWPEVPAEPAPVVESKPDPA